MISPHAAVALFLTLSVAAAQTPISQIETINTTPHAGVAVADVVVPFAAGAVRAPMQLVTDQGKVCQVEPMGARWPDGSLRYLRVDMPVQVAANERRRVKLFAHTGALPNFTPDSAVVAGIAGTRMYFVVGTKRVEF
ncbi:MAG: hypothetical protein H6836_06880, partial [Planctomycetes bacterium]|nr:hypothetical protein [Planctomycetota bacterium]